MMARKPEQERRHTIQVQQKYLVKDTSEAKVLGLGATCAEKVTDQDRYYDTNMFELAVSQTWLSQKNKQWHLIVGHQESDTQKAKASLSGKETKNSSTKQKRSGVTNAEHKGKGGKQILHCSSDHSTEDPSEEKGPDNRRKQNPQQSSQAVQHFNEQSSEKPVTANINADPGCTYHELTNEAEIIAHLATVTHTALTCEEKGNLTMKEFLQLAGIQHYASVYTARQVTYKLLDTYTITIQMDEMSSRKTAVISLDADVLNIAGGFDGIEKLANELDLQQLPE